MTSSRPLPVRLSPTPVRALSRRLASSQAAQDLTRHGIFPLYFSLVLVLSLLVGLLTHGWFLTWNGWEPIPTGIPFSVPCGNYCGTDAGLITTPATP